MSKPFSGRSIFLILLLASISIFLFSQWSFINTNFSPSKSQETFEKQKGVHIFGAEDSSSLYDLKGQNIEWITIVPWGFQVDYKDADVSFYDGDSTQLFDRISLVRDAGFKVFLKPHVWVDTTIEGKWRSEIFPLHDENWKLWQDSYKDFIFHYAKIAEQAGAEMFCVGTEFTRLALEKPQFWLELIQELRGIYSGKLIYAANWYREYEEITFWDKLDYIGIQAYFPLVDIKHPTVDDLTKAWKKYLPSISSLSKKHQRKVLFTEMGYKSTASAAIEPWLWAENLKSENIIFSEQTQANCYKAFFKNVWPKKWFAGVHIWQMRMDYKKDHMKEWAKLNFTPQGKIAEKIIAEGFKK